MKNILPTSSPNAFSTALEIIQSGGIVAFPTDTVYGLATNAFNPSAIENLFQIKGREHTKAIAVLIGSIEDIDKVTTQISPSLEKLTQAYWPGPLTLIVPRHPNLPEILSPTPTIGIRIPDHPDALRLLESTGPLAVTSANLTGEPDSQSAKDVSKYFGDSIDLILDGGKTPGGTPSTVVDLSMPNPTLLREGPIKFVDIQTLLG